MQQWWYHQGSWELLLHTTWTAVLQNEGNPKNPNSLTVNWWASSTLYCPHPAFIPNFEHPWLFYPVQNLEVCMIQLWSILTQMIGKDHLHTLGTACTLFYSSSNEMRVYICIHMHEHGLQVFSGLRSPSAYRSSRKCCWIRQLTSRPWEVKGRRTKTH